MLHTSRAILLIIVLLGASVGLQMERDRVYAASDASDELLYVPSGGVLQKMALSFDTLLADVYWIRTIQHYGGDRRAGGRSRFRYLNTLLDITTTLDPHFTIAYRFGAMFLAEPFPGGAGRPDQAVALLKKGLTAEPTRWQFVEDIGFIYYWQLRDFTTAADYLRQAAEIPGAPWWLRPLAAATLASGGNRSGSRLLWRQMLDSADNDWLRSTAQLRLRQLDALDQIDRLQTIVIEYDRRHGAPPSSWAAVIREGLLSGPPLDPAGVSYVLDGSTGAVTVSSSSPLFPLPIEPRTISAPAA